MRERRERERERERGGKRERERGGERERREEGRKTVGHMKWSRESIDICEHKYIHVHAHVYSTYL